MSDLTENTSRNGFDSMESFKKSLENIELYHHAKPDFFKYSSAIYLDIKNSVYANDNIVKSHLRTIYQGISCIRDEGWMFPKWQQNEYDSMVPVLLALYNLVEGFDWSSHNQLTSYAYC
jgi:hypothetical protein